MMSVRCLILCYHNWSLHPCIPVLLNIATFLCSILLSPLAKSSLVEMFDNIYIFNIALIF